MCVGYAGAGFRMLETIPGIERPFVRTVVVRSVLSRLPVKVNESES